MISQKRVCTINVGIDLETLAKLDRMCGDKSRSKVIREIIQTWIEKQEG